MWHSLKQGNNDNERTRLAHAFSGHRFSAGVGQSALADEYTIPPFVSAFTSDAPQGRLRILNSSGESRTVEIFAISCSVAPPERSKHPVASSVSEVERSSRYIDDEIKVSVWHDDFMNDDLYGRATVTLDHATLERGTLDVSMPNIKFVRLKFRQD